MICGLECDGGVTCDCKFIPPCTYCRKPEGENRICPICQDQWFFPFEIPPKFKYTPKVFQDYFTPMLKKDSNFKWDEMYNTHIRYSIIQNF